MVTRWVWACHMDAGSGGDEDRAIPGSEPGPQFKPRKLEMVVEAKNGLDPFALHQREG